MITVFDAKGEPARTIKHKGGSANQPVSESAEEWNLISMQPKWIGICAAAVLALGAACTSLQAQQALPGVSSARSSAVEYLFPEQVTVTANKSSEIALHFRIAEGLHINSHQPRQQELIPTAFSIPEGAGVRLESVRYPAGSDYALAIDPKTKLSVYAGDFTLQARIVAEKGNHLVEGKLRYQACDRNQCLPPKTIPVAIDVIGK
jgi:hypothetical protein